MSWLGRLRVLTGCLVAGGCGHPATMEDCEKIITRVAELELSKRPDLTTEERAKKLADAKEDLREATLRDCVGKKLSEKTMACVNQATDAKSLIDECL